MTEYFDENTEELEEVDVQEEELEVESGELEVSVPQIFLGPPERVSNPLSPFKQYLVFDYDKVSRWLEDANARLRDVIDYAVITEQANWHENNRDTILWWAVQALRSGGTLYVLDEYVGHEFLEGWDKKRKTDGYVPYIKP